VSPFLKIAAGLLLLYGVLVALVYVFQERLLYYPNMGREIVATPAAAGLAYDDFTIGTEDGEKLSAWWVPVPSPKGAVLLLHGNAGNISHRIDYAVMFRRLGYATLLVDYRGYGRSSGTPTEHGTYRDADAAWRWLTQTRGWKARDIVVFGQSLGGGIASWVASRQTPRALVLASTFTSAVDLGAELYRFLPVRLISRLRYDTIARLPDVRAPVLIAHSPGDDIIPYAHARRLYAAAREPKAFLELSGGHNDGFIFARSEWVEVFGAFLRQAEAQAKSNRPAVQNQPFTPRATP
jgi:fermentation-respiration switch protein FrsA (DUF1100 family)